MPRWQVTQTKYDELVEEFRRRGRNLTAVAAIVGVSWETARKALEHGWPERGFPAICHMLDVDAEAARAARADVDQREREQREKQAGEVAVKAAADRAKQVEQEVKLCEVTRAGALGLAAVFACVARSASKIVPLMQQQVEAWTASGAVSLEEAMQLFHKVAVLGARVSEIADRVMVMERRRLGEPIHIVGVVDDVRQLSEMELAQRSDEELLASLRAVVNRSQPAVN